ncbi:serine hydrolase domain-containing protein [Photobacterium sp. Hal280]|uniref:serine hydrolase domain-containing protein n=1 Tax=Photobacterium sp. Hal280 TaxID=3035163 RepID=UPI00301C657D
MKRIKPTNLLRSFSLVALCCLSQTASAVTTSPAMVGFPPAADSQVTFKNYRQQGKSDWAYNNISAVYNTVMMPRGEGVYPLPSVELLSGEDKAKIEQVFEGNQSDSVMIMKDGKIVLESYYGQAGPSRHHIWFSMTKSLTSTAFGILVEQGKVSLDASPADYIPELKGTGFERVTVQQVLNHSTGIDLKETYTDLNSPFLKYYAPALNLAYIPGGRDAQPENTPVYGVYDFIAHYIQPDSKVTPGEVFDYNSANADVLGWIIARVSGMPLNEFIQQHIWQKLGTEHDALMAVDRAYMPVATGGMITTLRDMARFGQMIMQGGTFNGQQVISKDWISQITQFSEKQKQKMAANPKYQDAGWQAYHNMWWILDAQNGEFAATGIHGQTLYINTRNKVVAAFFSHHETASNPFSDRYKRKLSVLRQIASKL